MAVKGKDPCYIILISILHLYGKLILSLTHVRSFDFLQQAFALFVHLNIKSSLQDYQSMLDKLKVIILLLFVLPTLPALNPICGICHDVVRAFQHSIPLTPPVFLADQIAIVYCTQKHLQQKNVCKGAIKEMVPIMLNSAWKHYSDPHLICSNIKLCSNEYTKRNLDNDVAKILQGKPDKQWEQPTMKKKLKVMHISDLHIDLFYTPGMPSRCTEPVCCRVNSTSRPNETLKAGYWGSLDDCDLPIQTFELFLKQLEKMELDLIIWTGDNTPHDVWQQSQSYNLNFTFMISEKLRKHTKARVVAAMGNHQSYPVNVYDYQGDRQKVLNGGLAQAWKPWLTESAYQMLRTKGYFSIILPELNNLKIVSMNTQAQNNQNMFLLRNPTDPGKMLVWVESELKQSQSKGQLVYIIGHIPPKDALNQWSMRFNALTDRYSYIIRGQFYGHTHSDHVCLFFSHKNQSQLVNYCLIAPSLQCGKNPQYRIMEIDYDTLQVTNYDQYMLDLRKYTKKQDDAKFEILYNFKNAYGLSDMVVNKGMTDFNSKMKNDGEIQKKYWYYRRSGLQEGKTGKQVYCDTMTSDTYYAKCMGTTYKLSLFEKVAGNWKDLKHKQ